MKVSRLQSQTPRPKNICTSGLCKRTIDATLCTYKLVRTHVESVVWSAHWMTGVDRPTKCVCADLVVAMDVVHPGGPPSERQGSERHGICTRFAEDDLLENPQRAETIRPHDYVATGIRRPGAGYGLNVPFGVQRCAVLVPGGEVPKQLPNVRPA